MRITGWDVLEDTPDQKAEKKKYDKERNDAIKDEKEAVVNAANKLELKAVQCYLYSHMCVCVCSAVRESPCVFVNDKNGDIHFFHCNVASAQPYASTARRPHKLSCDISL